ncbi:retrovirus-related pol polyprotein from transposon TNT 1-94 [Tanacetum coccineum]
MKGDISFNQSKYIKEMLKKFGLEGVDLLFESRDTNLYIISLDNMLKTSPIYLLSKASKTKSWLWHRRLSHLNFSTINRLAKDGLARGIPRLKFQKDHLCSACALGKSKKSSHQPKAEDTNQEKLYLLHTDLCGPMHVASINKKRIKDEAPEAIIKCIKNIQVHLNATVCNVRTDNGTEFFNQTLREFYENVGISHQTSVARTPQQNDVVERRNQTLVEAAHTMLIFSKAPLFLWAKAINTTCYTQNCLIIRRRYNKTSYELMQDKKPDLSFFHVFGALCYPTNDSDDLGKLDAKADIEFSSGPELQCMTPATSSSGLIPNPISQQPCILPNKDDWDYLFQPMFDEYFTPPSNAISQVQEVIAPRAVDLADSLVSTSINQDAPSSSTPSTQEQEQSLNISQGFEESPKTTIFHDDPLNESPHEESTSQGSSSNVRQIHTPFEHLVEPKNFKQAMTEPSWIDAMQEEIHEFERLQNKARLVAQGFRQEEGIDFEESFALDNPSHVYKLKKALYTLKQAPRAWYDMLSSFLISQHFSKGAIDPTLFTRQAGNDLLLVQIYVDDIIFASTNTTMCNKFANQMTTKFKMSMIGQMSFFLGLQISQSPIGVFINQSKYASKIVKKHGMLTTDSVDTPLVEKSNLDEDLQGTQVDATLYRGMIGSLMYLTSSRHELIHAVCLCARMSLTAYADADHAGCQDTRRSTSGSAQFLSDKLVSWSPKK